MTPENCPACPGGTGLQTVPSAVPEECKSTRNPALLSLCSALYLSSLLAAAVVKRLEGSRGLPLLWDSAQQHLCSCKGSCVWPLWLLKQLVPSDPHCSRKDVAKISV